MTVDDDNSIYVGGLSYDCTEDTLRRVFDIYGQIIAVKIINERGVGSKGYGFVTFANPRSAVDAINDMDGRTVDGRVVKVNEVKTRGGRATFGRENFRRKFDQMGTDLDRGRSHERVHGSDRERSWDRNRERSRDRDLDKGRGYDRGRDRDHDQDKRRGFDRSRDLDRTRDRFTDRDRDYNRGRELEDIKHEHDRNHDQRWDTDQDQGKEIKRTNSQQRNGNKDKDLTAKLPNGPGYNEHRSRDHPSDSSHGDHDQVEEQLDISRQKLGELKKEIFSMEELVEERTHDVSRLQEKSQKLEDALAAAKKLTSHRRKQLTKLHKCVLDMKEYGARLRSSQEELQSLVESAMEEVQHGEGIDVDGLLVIGNA